MPTKLIRSRELQFQSWQEVVDDVEMLLANGYTSTGNWTLGQAASHLAQWTSFPMNGYPTPPFIIRVIFAVLQRTGATKRMSEKILKEGFQPGSATDPSTIPSSSIDDGDGVQQLVDVCGRAKTFRGRLHPSPLFGAMDNATFQKVSLLHAAHHLSYFSPKQAP